MLASSDLGPAPLPPGPDLTDVRSTATEFSRAGVSLRAMSADLRAVGAVPGWKGRTATLFRGAVEVAADILREASNAFGDAAATLSKLVRGLELARETWGRAEDLLRRAEGLAGNAAATGEAVALRRAADSLADEARHGADVALRAADDGLHAAAHRLAELSSGRPPQPDGFWGRAVHVAHEFGRGVWDSESHLMKLAVALDGVNLDHPEWTWRAFRQMAADDVQVARHPKEFGHSLHQMWQADPARLVGMLTPMVVIAVASEGAGAEVAAAEIRPRRTPSPRSSLRSFPQPPPRPSGTSEPTSKTKPAGRPWPGIPTRAMPLPTGRSSRPVMRWPWRSPGSCRALSAGRTGTVVGTRTVLILSMRPANSGTTRPQDPAILARWTT